MYCLFVIHAHYAWCMRCITHWSKTATEQPQNSEKKAYQHRTTVVATVIPHGYVLQKLLWSATTIQKVYHDRYTDLAVSTVKSVNILKKSHDFDRDPRVYTYTDSTIVTVTSVCCTNRWPIGPIFVCVFCAIRIPSCVWIFLNDVLKTFHTVLKIICEDSSQLNEEAFLLYFLYLHPPRLANRTNEQENNVLALSPSITFVSIRSCGFHTTTLNFKFVFSHLPTQRLWKGGKQFQ